MSHIRKDAPNGFIYRYKGAENEFAVTVYIGSGRAEEDYELISATEYERILAERKKTIEIL